MITTPTVRMMVAVGSSGVAKLGHTGACALATRACAPPVQALLKIIDAECVYRYQTRTVLKSAQRTPLGVFGYPPGGELKTWKIETQVTAEDL